MDEDTIRLRIDLRIPEQLYEFLSEESDLQKMSFEGLILRYIRERMEGKRRRLLGPEE